jgi:26S proteasome regulatory subunit N3
MNRALRYTFSKLRRRLTSNLLLKAVKEFYPSLEGRRVLLEQLGEKVQLHFVSLILKVEMDVEATTAKEITPEVEVFLQLLGIVRLIDSKKYAEAVKHSEWLIEQLMSNWNRRTLDPLSAKVYFYFSRAHELNGEFSEIRPYEVVALITYVSENYFNTKEQQP